MRYLGARYQITNPMTRNAQFKAERLNVDVLLVDKFGLHRILRREGFATPVNSSCGSELVGRGQYARSMVRGLASYWATRKDKLQLFSVKEDFNPW